MQKTPPTSSVRRPSAQILEALQRAFTAFQTGKLGEAEALFKKVPFKDTSQFDALNMLAVIHAQRGDYSEGIRLVSRARWSPIQTSLKPISPSAACRPSTPPPATLWMGLPVHIDAAYAQMWERSQRGERAYRIRR